jgi:hypothetical protein
MEDILIVPDVHGRDFWLPALKYQGEIIFLGDYTDPYPAENLTQEDAYQGFLKIVEFKEQNPDRVTLLIGNHELHYYNKYMQAGRFSYEYFEKYHAILTGEQTKDLFRMCKMVDKYLFIHAGITKDWYDRHLADLQKYGDNIEDRINNLFKDPFKMSAFYEASMRYRGGLDDSGSPLWADVHELLDETEHFDNNTVQIFGHTQILDDEPIIKGNICMLDNRRLYILRQGKIEKY